MKDETDHDELAELNRKTEELRTAPVIQRACPHYPDCLAIKKNPCEVYDENKKQFLQCNIHLTEMECGVWLTEAQPKGWVN